MSLKKSTVATVELLMATALTVGLWEFSRQTAVSGPDDRETIAELKKRVAKLEAEVAEMRKALLRAGGITDSATEIKQISEVAKLRIADLQQRTKNTHAVLRDVRGGVLVGRALRAKINDLNNDLTSLWAKMASYGVGRDPYLDNIQVSDSGSIRASSPPDHGLPGSYASLGLPRLHERFLEAAGAKGKVADTKKAEFKKLVQAYSNPAVFTHREFNDRAYNEYRDGKNLFTPQYMADLKALDLWLTDLADVLEKQSRYFDKLP